MENDEMLALLAALILPTVKADMEASDDQPEDLLEVIQESVLYAADLVEAVNAHIAEPGDDDDGEKVEVIPPRRRHA